MSSRDPAWMEDYRERGREQDREDELERERIADRMKDHAPAPRPLPPQHVTGAMVALAWTVLTEDEHEEAARALAQLVLGASAPVPDESREERYRKALWRIAGAQSGMWGWIAHEALKEAGE